MRYITELTAIWDFLEIIMPVRNKIWPNGLCYRCQSFKSDGPKGVWGRSILEMFRAPKNLQFVYSQQGHLKAFYKFTKRADTI